jgi:cobyrinic acid a,c-diamide synthase
LADGFVIAAPASGSGKTIVTLALLGALRKRGITVASAKIGPDYIDPQFHQAATRRDCFNLDGWAMTEEAVKGFAAELGAETALIVIEGVMGLFDGPEEGPGSTADIAEQLRLPAILVVDCSHQAQSIAALVHGFHTHRPGLSVPAVILNRVASIRHADMLRKALAQSDVAVLGAVPRDASLALPSRHLGLVQAGEHENLARFLERASENVAAHIDMTALLALAKPIAAAPAPPLLPPLGQRMAIARDEAFAFLYPHLVSGWRRQGAELTFFSPLADEHPDALADAIYLPGGYPELHAERLSKSEAFLGGLRSAARRDRLIYGECGGYMVLGQALIAADGGVHEMAGLLPVTTSFARCKLHLGYRRLKHRGTLPWPKVLKGHEFHYSAIESQDQGTPLFEASDAAARDLGSMGLSCNRVMGSYAHVIA